MFMKKEAAQEGLSIIIVGCGKVGATIIEKLTKEGHDITIVDKDADKIEDITNTYDIMGIRGNGASYSTLMEAGIEKADLIIAVTESDELNLLCCTIATQVGDCAAIARVRTPDYSVEANYLREKLGLAMIINPELESANEAARILYMPTALEVNTFAHGQAELIKFKIPRENALSGHTVADIGKKLTEGVLISTVERGEDVYIPTGDFELKEGDVISFIATRKLARQFLNKVGMHTRKVKDTIIIGGGKATYYLAKQLLEVGVEVKIVERDKKKCEELSILLPKAIIINGDGTDEDLLKEVGIEEAQSFVPLTGIDEENIMLTLHAMNVSEAKVITKINKINFKDVVGKLDLGSVIYPRYITSEAIIAYVRARKASKDSNIETLYHLCDSRVESIEFLVKEESEVTGKQLMKLKLKDNMLIAFINRNGKIIIPTGTDEIHVGDTICVVTTHTGFRDIHDILA